MDIRTLEGLLKELQDGTVEVDAVVEALRRAPVSGDAEFTPDTHRELRCGFPEVVFGESKTADQICAIARSMMQQGQQVIITRVEQGKAGKILEAVPQAVHHPEGGIVSVPGSSSPPEAETVLVVSAGTSDQPVAEEAAVTAELMGAPVKRLRDVGVAGIHRILSQQRALREASVLIVVAGMEGALPSVVAGLTDRPVIAVPTSVGYGTNLQGVTTLLAMMSSCASGVTVVNIDNGFGAGYAAVQIARLGVHDG